MRVTVRGPAQRRASPCRHDMPCRGSNIACRVHIGVAGETARPAPEGGLALARLPIHDPTRRTTLTGEPRIDLDYPARSLVLQAGHQLTPPAGKDAPIQTRLLPHTPTRRFTGTLRRPCHVGDLEIFDHDHVELQGQAGAGFLDPILTTIGFAGLEPRDRRLELAAPGGAALCPGELALQPQQAGLLCSLQSWYGQQFPSGQSRRHHDTSIHAYRRTRAGRGNGLGHHGERHMPTPSTITRDPKRLHTLGNRTRPPESHPADLRHPHLTNLARDSAHVTRFDRHDPEPLAPPAAAPGRPSVGSAEEVRHRLSVILQRLLLHDHRTGSQPRVVRPRLGQLPTLLGVPRRLATRFPMGVLLHSEIPHEPGMTTMLQQHPLLLRRRLETKSGHADQASDHHRKKSGKPLIPSKPERAQDLPGLLPPICPRHERRSVLGMSW
ncbi:hypothetical protein SAMN05192558_12031 [Actinokineospora alba]|uniref:Uncharacterized protein n=1 Tax=Actinokineospora alba TaxID=504798 RepID=A0A1H0WE77_9PSEU|nr:hypothetical protein C8E96_4453 [Actinokineospora alba]SDI74262.1 hypothetical protein SAMN05421871_107156 [Actinokineospora alba]SDP88873.1 hypothetical protein SAMN05192558_12031 [Actinokineospora alba]